MKTRFFHKQSVVTALLFLAGAYCFGQGDTVLQVRVPYSIQVNRTITGSRMVEIKLPKPKPETVYVYQCPPPAQPGALALSKWNGSLQQLVDSAIRSGRDVLFDKPLDIAAPVLVKGNVRIVGNGRDTVFGRTSQMFVLDSGRHEFDSLVLIPQEWAFITQGLAINDSISNSRIVGGKFSYQTSLGRGVTAFRNCYLQNSDINIQVYSQTANGVKALHLYDVELRTDITHNVYAHPNVNIHWERVNASKSGRLALNYFSSGHDEYYGQAKYFRLIKCTGSPMSTYTVVGPAGGFAVVDSCNIAPYGTWERARVTNSNLYNGGQGALINGTVDRCTGEVWTGGGTTTVTNSNLSFATARAGGVLRLNNTSISGQLQVADRGNPFSVVIDGGNVGYIFDGQNGAGSIRITNTKIPPNNCRAGMIQ